MMVLAGLVPSTCGYKANTLTELALRFSVTQLISSYNYIPVNLWELLGRDLPPTNPSKGEILCVAFKRTNLYLVVAYM